MEVFKGQKEIPQASGSIVRERVVVPRSESGQEEEAPVAEDQKNTGTLCLPRRSKLSTDAVATSIGRN